MSPPQPNPAVRGGSVLKCFFLGREPKLGPLPCSCSVTLCFLLLHSQVGLNVLIQRANKFTPATRLLIQRFVPFPAVGKDKFPFLSIPSGGCKLSAAQSPLGWTQLLPSCSVIVPGLGQEGIGPCKAEFWQKNPAKLLLEAAPEAFQPHFPL